MAQQGYGFGGYGKSNWSDLQYELGVSSISVTASVSPTATQIDVGEASISVTSSTTSAGNYTQLGAK